MMEGRNGAGMNGIFGPLIPHIPARLVPDGVIEMIRSLNRHLPANLSTVGGLECRLTGSDPFAGWILGVNAEEGGREALIRPVSEGGLSPSLLQDDRWRFLKDFAEAWSDPGSPLHRGVADIWLEFDPDVLDLPVPIPGVFFNTRSPAPGSDLRTGPSPAMRKDVLETVLHLARRSSLPETAQESLDRCMKEVPTGAEIPFVALMMSRTKAGVRIILSMQADEVRGFLGRIGWSGPLEESSDLLSDLAPRVDRVYLHLDVAEAVLPRLGLECLLMKKQPRIEPRWHSLLEYLVEVGLCDAGSRDAVLSWPGHTRGILHGDAFPSYLFRGISHVKIVLGAGSPALAKGYLGFRRLDEDHYPEFHPESTPEEDA